MMLLPFLLKGGSFDSSVLTEMLQGQGKNPMLSMMLSMMQKPQPSNGKVDEKRESVSPVQGFSVDTTNLLKLLVEMNKSAKKG